MMQMYLSLIFHKYCMRSIGEMALMENGHLPYAYIVKYILRILRLKFLKIEIHKMIIKIYRLLILKYIYNIE